MPTKSQPISVLEPVKSDLCGKQIVLLGESGTHGDGATEQFKAELVQSLVKECGFKLILFEASFYQSVWLQRLQSGKDKVTVEDLAAAIGGLWKNDQEVQSLLNFLTERINDGDLSVAGIDDQLGGRGQDFANFYMPVELAQYLDPEIASDCRELLERRIIHDFPDGEPYSLADKQFLLDCYSWVEGFDEIGMLRANIASYIGRDFDQQNYFAGRAKSMFMNFQYWYDQNKHPKTILWTATVHAAKARGQLGGPTNTGTFIHERFGDQAFVLGFSALDGQYRKMRGEVFELPEAPKNSIEFRAMSQTKEDILYLDMEDLAAFGKLPASIYNQEYIEDDWSEIIDGLIIFREQYPTTIVED